MLRDLSAYRNHGLLTGMDPATDWILAEKPVGGHALQFDGLNDTVVVGTGYPRPVKPISISIWVRVDDLESGNYHKIMIGDANLTTLGSGWAIQVRNASTIRFWVNHWNNNIAEFTTFTDTANWHHVVGIYDGATIKIWIDGVLGGTTDTYTSNIDYTDATGLQFGKGYIANDDWYEGRIGGVAAVYNRAITDAERQLLFERPYVSLMPRVRALPGVVEEVAVGGPFPHYTRRTLAGGMIGMGG